METASICGLCLGRLKYQINNAKRRAVDESGRVRSGRVLLESYYTGEPDEIIDILDLYHVKDRTREGVIETLAELSYSASVLTRESLHFDFNEEGHFGLYLNMK